ncbi:SixA phosphatase family protein [Sphingomonas sp. ac-8]|uniref:SixA phosphatase family protein n=1 Tax=Sphingomonas sp. ac-8 TaxID=3242977 RepID=UPI003A80426F
MKTLTLLRHAKSGWDDPVSRDFDRPLNAKGARAAETMGRHLRSLGLAFDLVVASPAVRVQETLDHFATGLGETLAPEWDRRLYLASEATLLDVVRALPDSAERVLLVGHNPGMEELALVLAGAGALREAVEAKFPTASVAVLEIGAGWDTATDGTATLAHFIRPRDVDPSLGPDFG